MVNQEYSRGFFNGVLTMASVAGCTDTEISKALAAFDGAVKKEKKESAPEEKPAYWYGEKE